MIDEIEEGTNVGIADHPEKLYNFRRMGDWHVITALGRSNFLWIAASHHRLLSQFTNRYNFK
jgi:hypothetical protein